MLEGLSQGSSLMMYGLRGVRGVPGMCSVHPDESKVSLSSFIGMDPLVDLLVRLTVMLSKVDHPPTPSSSSDQPN